AVGVDHADQVEVREIVSLREDLSADQNIDLAALDLPAHGGPDMTAPDAVPVYAQNPRLREIRDERRFDALRSLAQGRQVLVAAMGAREGNALFVPAVVAAQVPVAEMENELRRAAVAARCPAAAAADQYRCKAAAIDENQALVAPRVERPYRFDQAGREALAQ